MRQVFICSNKEQYDEIISRINDDIRCVCWNDLLQKAEQKIDQIVEDGDVLYIAADERQLEALLKLGIRRDRICVYSFFRDTTFSNPMEGIFTQNSNGLILGMSHAQCGIDEKLLKNADYFKVASPSMDAFLHLKYYEKISEDYPEETKQIKSIIIELPYYVFNYDLSRFGKFLYTKLNYFKIIGNFHHFGETVEQKVIIRDFYRFLQIFKEQPKITVDSKKSNLLRCFAKKIINGYRIATLHDKVWFSSYPKTIQENKKYLSDLIKLIKTHSPDAKISVLVMPFNPIFRKTHIKVCNKWKILFYTFFEELNIKIIDTFNSVSSSLDFNDHCHLNSKGREKYSKHLATMLIEIEKD